MNIFHARLSSLVYVVRLWYLSAEKALDNDGENEESFDLFCSFLTFGNKSTRRDTTIRTRVYSSSSDSWWMATSIDALKGTWDYIEGDCMEKYLKELGIGRLGRMMARNLKPRLIISENNEGQWTLRTEITLRTMIFQFRPEEEYQETTPDGRQLTGIIRFENGKWIQKILDKSGKESFVTRWVDDNDQQQIILQCGQTQVRRSYKRAEEKD